LGLLKSNVSATTRKPAKKPEKWHMGSQVKHPTKPPPNKSSRITVGTGALKIVATTLLTGTMMRTVAEYPKGMAQKI
jgi:hypothetical protein